MLFTTSGARCPTGSWCSMSCGVSTPPANMDQAPEALPLLPAGPGRPRPQGEHQGSRSRIVLAHPHRARRSSTGFLRRSCHLPPWCFSRRADRRWGRPWTSAAGGTGWWWYWWPCFWGYRYRWGPSGRSASGSCPCPWRYALAILQQPMVRAHLDVALPGIGGGPRPQLQPAAMFTPDLLPSSRRPGPRPLSPASSRPGLGDGTRPLWRSPSAPWD